MMTPTTTDPLDLLSPDEAHLAPPCRTWARTIRIPTTPYDVLELRDPCDGQGADPATRARHQYQVARGLLWRRRLPPAPLDEPEDETPWVDDPHAARWEVVTEMAPHSPILAWAREQEPAVRLGLATPRPGSL
jgi:hypothetical protein